MTKPHDKPAPHGGHHDDHHDHGHHGHDHDLEETLKAFERLHHSLKQTESTIMSAISDFYAVQTQHNTAITTAVEGLTTDIAAMKALIDELQTNPGPISPADQALLDQLVTMSASVSQQLASLDQLTPPTPPGNGDGEPGEPGDPGTDAESMATTLEKASAKLHSVNDHPTMKATISRVVGQLRASQPATRRGQRANEPRNPGVPHVRPDGSPLRPGDLGYERDPNAPRTRPDGSPLRPGDQGYVKPTR